MARKTSTWSHELKHAIQLPLAVAKHLWNKVRPVTREPESPDVATGRILAIAAGWTGFVAVSLVGFGWYTLSLAKLSSPSQDAHALPSPQLQVNPADDFDRLTAVQRKRLDTYAWADRERGLVQIPVERAMAILAARGEAAFAPLGPPAPDTARARAVDAATRAGASR